MNVLKLSIIFKSYFKFLKFKEIVFEYFEKFQGKSDEDLKGVVICVMIFLQYRDSVNEIVVLLFCYKFLV